MRPLLSLYLAAILAGAHNLYRPRCRHQDQFAGALDFQKKTSTRIRRPGQFRAASGQDLLFLDCTPVMILAPLFGTDFLQGRAER